MYRIVLAALIALAVAMAPVGSALAAAHALANPPMEDCHGKAPNDQSCCDVKAKCADSCGIKCCKLMGMIVALALTRAPAPAEFQVADPQRPPDWKLRPRPPPPRS